MSNPKKKLRTDEAETMSEDREAAVADGQEQTPDTGEDVRVYIDRLQRLQAEFENYKKRTARDYALIEERVADQTILGFLGLYDNLERAFAGHATDRDTESFVAGIEQIFSQFSQHLEQLGVERIPGVGEPFDPAVHEALLSVRSEQAKNTILEEFLPGYRRTERVLRTSKVSVSQGPAPLEEADE